MKKFSIDAFLKLGKEQQAKEIEKQTQELLKRLPKLKKDLQAYDDVSDELYNLKQDELELMSSTYANAVRRDEITTPNSKQAYQRFIKQLNKYARRDMRYLAMQTAKKRMDTWLNNVESNGSEEEIAYAKELIKQMSDKDKQEFTLSKYFLDVSNWNSDDFKKAVNDGSYSMQTLELELWMEKKGYNTKNIYNRFVAKDGQNIVRKGYRQKNKGR